MIYIGKMSSRVLVLGLFCCTKRKEQINTKMVKDEFNKRGSMYSTVCVFWWNLIGQEGNISRVAAGLTTVLYKAATKSQKQYL